MGWGALRGRPPDPDQIARPGRCFSDPSRTSEQVVPDRAVISGLTDLHECRLCPHTEPFALGRCAGLLESNMFVKIRSEHQEHATYTKTKTKTKTKKLGASLVLEAPALVHWCAVLVVDAGDATPKLARRPIDP